MVAASLRFGLLAGLLLAVAVDAKKKKKGSSDVLTFTSENFDQAIIENDPVLVAFTAPWCGHCKKLKPEFEAAATELKAEKLHLANVDATQEQDLASKFGVTGFPTLKFFKNGKAQDYNGGRDKASIVQWIRRKAGAAAATLSTTAEVEAFTKRGDVGVLAFVDSVTSDLAKAVLKAADESEDVPYALVPADAADSAAVRDSYKVAATGEAVVAVNNFEGEDNVVHLPAGDLAAASGDAAVLSRWVNGHSLPQVVTFSSDTAPKIFRGPLKTHLLLFADADAEAGTPEGDALAGFRAAAKDSKARDVALFVIVPPSEDRIMGYFGVEEGSLPTAILVHMGDAGLRKFNWPAGAALADASAYAPFLADFAAGSLKPFLKSEPAPDAATNDAAAVRVITGNTFTADVIESPQDVLLEVYAPWCGHCKTLAPIYEGLGKAVAAAGLKDILTIAKMDGTGNEVDYPGMEVKGFPTIVFFKGGDKAKPIEYEGARDAAGMVAFLKKHAAADHAERVAALDASAVASDGEGEEDEE